MDERAEMAAGRVVRKALLTFVSLTIVVGCLTVLFLGMRAVLEIGGTCASGGPYEIARPCPQGTWMMPVSILVGLIALGLYIGNRSGLPGPEWWTLAWPALFLSLGWNFWEYGLAPPGPDPPSTDWSLIVCGVLFGLMGGLPLIGILWSPGGRRSLVWADAEMAPDPTTTRQVATKLKPTVRPKPVPSGAVVAPGAPADDMAEDLERLAALYRRGDLTVDEYQSAKSQRIGGRRA